MGEEENLLVERPASLSCEMKVPHKTLCGPGPTNMYPRVQQSLSLPLLGHLHKEFTKIMDDIQEGIRYLFQTKNDVTFALAGTGHAGMECALGNLVEPADIVCVISSGVWGQRCADMVKRLGAFPKVVNSKHLGAGVELGDVRQALQESAPKVLYVAQGESSTGVLEDVEGIAALCSEFGCLSIVDTVASIGGVPFFMDKWGVDCVFTGSQKVLGCPPGSALISFSQRAVEKFRLRATPVTSYLFDLANNAKYWNIEGFGPRGYHYTGAIMAMYALRESLSLICEEGLIETQNRHKDAALYLHQKLQDDLKLSLFVDNPKFRVPTVTTIRCREGVDPAQVSAYVMNNFALEVSGGLGPTGGLLWRIGLMGPNATRANVDFVIKCFEEALNHATSNS